MKNFGVIGMGNMAEAIVGGALRKGVLQPENICACEKDPNRQQLMKERLILPCDATADQAAGCDVLMIAVKPQHTKEVLQSLQLKDTTLVISIVAGVTTATMDKYLQGRGRLIRTMPNTPLMAGRGVTALSQGPRATQKDAHWVKDFFGAIGLSLIVPEDLIDTVAAISGSGPAYFFYIIEALTQAGISHGLEPNVALQLSTETCAGAAALLTSSQQDPATLRRNVTSPGGSTAEAIAVFDKEKMQETIIRGVEAAIRRNSELGQQDSQ